MKLVDGMYEPYIARGEEPLTLDATSLLTWRRFDVAIKTLHLKRRFVGRHGGADCYAQHISAFTRGMFAEPGNATKNSLERYVADFDAIEKSIAAQGFNSAQSLVPLSVCGTLVNGAHRVAACIHNGRQVSAVRTMLPAPTYDWKFFATRGVDERLLGIAAIEFLRLKPTARIALIWPRAGEHAAEVLASIPNVIFRKSLPAKGRTLWNLLMHAYWGQPWLKPESSFLGLRSKLAEVSGSDNDVTVVAFDATDIGDLVEFKERLRQIADVAKHSIHICDGQEDTLRLAELAFSETGRHYLNNARPPEAMTLKLVAQMERIAAVEPAATKHLVVSGGLLLGVYGLRRPSDIDVVAYPDSCRQTIQKFPELSDHEAYAHFHGVDKHLLLHDSFNHIVLWGWKFASFERVLEFKRTRDEQKDRGDVVLMRSIEERDARAEIAAKFALLRLQTEVRLVNFAARMARKFGLERPLKRIYRKVIRRS